MPKTYDEKLAEMNAQIVTGISGVGITRGQLAAIFKVVHSKEHWKNPIDAVISDQELLEIVPHQPMDYQALIMDAVTYFVGGCEWPERVVLAHGGGYRVVSEGYWNIIGA